MKVVVDAATADRTAILSTATVSSAIGDPDASDDSSSVVTMVSFPATPVPVTPTPAVTPAGTALTPVPAGTPSRRIVCRRVLVLKRLTYREAKRKMKRSSCKVSLRRRGPFRRNSGRLTRVRSQRPRAGPRILYRGQTIRVTLR